MIKSKSTRIGDFVVVALCLILIFVCLVPMLNVLARSLSSTEYLIRNEVLLWPKGFNFEAYKTVLAKPAYVHSLWYTALLTVGCTLLSLFMTVICAYPLTYDQLKGGKFINGFILFTMYFSAEYRNPCARLPRSTARARSAHWYRSIFRFPSLFWQLWHCSMRSAAGTASRMPCCISRRTVTSILSSCTCTTS